MLFKPYRKFYEAPDDKGGGDTGTPPAGTPPDNSGKKPITFESEEAYQADIEAKLKERLERERKKAEQATLKAKADAEAEAAKKNGEWQKLAEQREAEAAALTKKLAELEPVSGKAERYEATLKKYLEAQKKDLPAHILALLEKLDPVDQLEYITANADVLRKPEGDAPDKRPLGTPPARKPLGGNKDKKDADNIPVHRVAY